MVAQSAEGFSLESDVDVDVGMRAFYRWAVAFAIGATPREVWQFLLR
jgi:hypothetical protein